MTLPSRRSPLALPRKPLLRAACLWTLAAPPPP